MAIDGEYEQLKRKIELGTYIRMISLFFSWKADSAAEVPVLSSPSSSSFLILGEQRTGEGVGGFEEGRFLSFGLVKFLYKFNQFESLLKSLQKTKM